MKVAFFTYPSAFQNVGGGEVLLLKIREYLQKEGIEIDLFDTWNAKVEHYDLVHVFGSVKDCLGLVKVANSRGIKVVITPLLWSDPHRFPLRHFVKWFFPYFPSSRRKLLLSADMIFPNSEMEKEQIARLFAVSKNKMKVVYNGVDKSFGSADLAPFRSKFGTEPFILSVGRIEPRKNQLNLIKAIKKLDNKKLILIGSPVSGYEKYFEICQQEAQGFTTFIPALAHNDPMLASAYAACELFVLQGWFETPGLVALEAALAGARMVVTCGGSTREYFKDYADYIDPSNPSDIAEKIEKNLLANKDDRLKSHVFENFTWDKIARQTLSFYQEAMRSKG